ncbi:bifunctional (p)ppGpp synthetase/guanosine-3',5'-bis(diphosphate) 3'-pyrophosphohydrolase [Candidatus Parcubacteria bacterium]|nr:bifunctional (p)ppGpp synthetase/guanosine-3',5'-bis(diphosphate) 3'-pyrophosphohydrolase [Candidatus Parcubacteria bacterium]
MTIQQIINKVKSNNPKADIDLLKLAYDFAEQAHDKQKRQTGEPYIQHSLHTAFLLAQIKADINTVIAGILHDVPEDTEKTLKDVEKNFGAEIAGLVEGITKLSKIKYRGVERYRESLRKMFLAMARDLRVILIKFCDRLHNLRTLDALPLEKRTRIARETMEIYAPIAGLLGIWRLKWQMEDICFKYLYPEEFKKLEYKYEVEKKAERNQYSQKIKNILGAALKKEKIKYEIEDRFKHLYSIYKKMQNKNRKFDEIYDVFALRVIAPTISDCYKTMGIIHSIWKPNPDRIKDYIAVPKPNGYRSLHTTVFGLENRATEFQIRTREMHEEALYGIAAHWHYKQKSGSKTSHPSQPRWIQEILRIQRESESTNDFISNLKLNVFHDRIFVFSPQGDAFDLPKNSTPIDFAYIIHTEVGNKATGTLINNKMSSLDQPLKNGDLVEIITEKNRKGPNRDWLKFVRTHRAREKIKQATKSTTMDQLKKMIPGI